MNHDFYKLMLVTHRQKNSLSEYLGFIKKCVSAGVTSVQLREKNSDPAVTREFALRLKDILPSDVALIVNDDLALAAQIDADGVHLGQSDTSPQMAREVLGINKHIGLSIELKDQLITANHLSLDYVAASAVFPSEHKPNLKTIWGLEGLEDLCNMTKHPIVGIGGINQHNLPDVLKAGAKGVAVIGALHQATNPTEMTQILRRIIDKREN